MKLKSVKTKLLALYFLAYGALACYFPFMAVYFKSRGLTYMQAGIAFSVTSLVSIAAQPIMGYIADKHLSKKKVIMINMLACSALIYFYVLADSFYTVLAAIIALILFQSSTMSITDAYCYDIADQAPEINYGQIRLMGSIGFAVISLILGRLIQYFNIHVGFFLYSVLFLSSALILRSIRYKSKASIVRPSAQDILIIIKNFRFILFVVSVMLLNIMLSAHSSYIVTLIEATGGNVANLGLMWFAQAISEIPVFFFGSRLLRKFGVLNVYITAVVLYIIRMLLSAYSSSYAAVIAIQLMQSITYPLYLISAMQFINLIVSDKVRATGITLLASLGFGLGGLIGNLGGGFVLQYTNPFYLYKALTAACCASLAIALLLKSKTGKASNSTHA